MKLTGLAVAALALLGGVPSAAAAGDSCCASKKIAKSPLLEKADSLEARWEKAAAVELSEADKEACEKARGTLAEMCPVCKRMPETIGFLTTAVGFANALEASCESHCKSEEAAAKFKEIPSEIKTAFAERSALLKSANHLLGAAFGDEAGAKSCAKGEGAGCCSKEKKEGVEGCSAEGKKACSQNPDCYAALQKKADGLLVAWDGIPGQFAAFSKEDRARLQSAMAAVMKGEGERCALFSETMKLEAELLGRAAEIDSEIAKACKEKAEICPLKDTPLCPMSEAASGRNALLRKTAQLLEKMGKTLNPAPGNPIFAQR